MVSAISSLIPGTVDFRNGQSPGLSLPASIQTHASLKPETTKYYGTQDANAIWQARHPRFSAANLRKEEGLAVALSVRESERTLERALQVSEAMRERALAIVKNYPPFPPGSEERRQYIESIQALRRQMEALVLPTEARPTAGLPLPVEYRLPPIDAYTSTDEELAELMPALDQLDAQLTQARQSLTRLVLDLPDWTDLLATTSVPDVADASALSVVVGHGLGLERATLSQDREAVALLGYA